MPNAVVTVVHYCACLTVFLVRMYVCLSLHTCCLCLSHIAFVLLLCRLLVYCIYIYIYMHTISFRIVGSYALSPNGLKPMLVVCRFISTLLLHIFARMTSFRFVCRRIPFGIWMPLIAIVRMHLNIVNAHTPLFWFLISPLTFRLHA